MNHTHSSLKFFLNLATIQARLTRRFDAGLNGLSLNEFMILYHLSQARDEKLRRVDLAEKIGLTASGVTRLLLPMEKVGLVKKEVNKDDARVSYAALAAGGKRKLSESLEYAELLAEDLLPKGKAKHIEDFSALLAEFGGTIK
jgi:DNA-binding MarR family transcriptional regulator